MPFEPVSLLRELVALPGPPGQEEAVRAAVAAHAERLGCPHVGDERGNLVIGLPGQDRVPDRVDILVMAHLDEIAMIVERFTEDGYVRVAPLGGIFPWKYGEGPVSILAPGGVVPGILSFGSIHTSSTESLAARAKDGPLTWDMARIFTGESGQELEAAGVRPGTRVVLGSERRVVVEFGDYVAAPFLDDRADLVSMLLAIEGMRATPIDGPLSIAFAATASEEVGGHGSLYLLRRMQPEIAIALEIGPRVPESLFPLDERPTVWAHDSYATMQARDHQLVAEAAVDAGIDIRWQSLSRGGSDASCGASHGMVARPITLAFGAENSHGFEIAHRDSIVNLSKLLVAVLNRLQRQ